MKRALVKWHDTVNGCQHAHYLRVYRHGSIHVQHFRTYPRGPCIGGRPGWRKTGEQWLGAAYMGAICAAAGIQPAAGPFNIKSQVVGQ